MIRITRVIKRDKHPSSGGDTTTADFKNVRSVETASIMQVKGATPQNKLQINPRADINLPILKSNTHESSSENEWNKNSGHVKNVHVVLETDEKPLMLDKDIVNTSDTNNQGFKCLVCGKTFSIKGNLKVHMRIHDNVRPFKCSEENCDMAFRTKQLLKQHAMSHAGIKSWHCDICDKGFSSKNALKEHSSRHTDTKPYKCPHCDREFRQFSVMSRHALTHTNERGKYQCSICKKHFKFSMYLKSHMKSHTGERPFKCEICLKSYAHRSDLNRHKIIHKDTKPYSCCHCNARFNDVSSKKRHEREHTETKQIQCDYCSETFKRMSHLKGHVARKHLLYDQNTFRHVIGEAAQILIPTSCGDAVPVQGGARIQIPATHARGTLQVPSGDQQVRVVEIPVADKAQFSVAPVVVSSSPIQQKGIQGKAVKTEPNRIIEVRPDDSQGQEASFSLSSALDKILESNNSNCEGSLDSSLIQVVNFSDIEENLAADPNNTIIKQEVSESPQNPSNAEIRIKLEENTSDASHYEDGIIQRVSVPKIEGQTIALDTEALLSSIQDELEEQTEPVQVTCSVLQDFDDHQIIGVHYLNVRPKQNTAQNSSPQKQDVTVSNESTDLSTESLNTENESASLKSTNIMYNQQSDTLEVVNNILDKNQNDSAQSKDSLNQEQCASIMKSTETKQYSQHPEFTKQEYYNWLSLFATAARSHDMPLSRGVYMTIASVKSALTGVMVSPSGVLQTKENFSILVSIWKDLVSVIERHLELVLSELQDEEC